MENRLEHFYHLKDGFEHFLLGSKFICLSNGSLDFKRIPLIHSWPPRWWAKMECRARSCPTNDCILIRTHRSSSVWHLSTRVVNLSDI